MQKTQKIEIIHLLKTSDIGQMGSGYITVKHSLRAYFFENVSYQSKKNVLLHFEIDRT